MKFLDWGSVLHRKLKNLIKNSHLCKRLNVSLEGGLRVISIFLDLKKLNLSLYNFTLPTH